MARHVCGMNAAQVLVRTGSTIAGGAAGYLLMSTPFIHHSPLLLSCILFAMALLLGSLEPASVAQLDSLHTYDGGECKSCQWLPSLVVSSDRFKSLGRCDVFM